MYDEFERALTGKSPRRSPTPLGWVAIGLTLVLVTGVVGIGYGVSRAAMRVRHMVRDLDAPHAIASARTLAHLQRSSSLVALDPRAGVSFLHSVGSGDPAQALVRRVVGRRLSGSAGFQLFSDAPRQDDAGSATVHSSDGDVHVDVIHGSHGGSLVLTSKDGHVRFNLVKSSNGGTLTIDSDDGHARIDLVRSGDGGRLVIHGDDGAVELAVGSGSRSAPNWVPRPKVMPDQTRPVFSLVTRNTKLGAVTWEDDATPGEWVASYRKTLEQAGYDVQDEYSRSGPHRNEASLWARRDRDDRTVFVLARRLDSRTHEVLGYGEGDVGDR